MRSCEYCDGLRAEVERLTARYEPIDEPDARKYCDHLNKQIVALVKDYDALRATNTALKEQIATMIDNAGKVAALRAENARLREALEEHACGCVDRCMEDREKYGEYTKFENAICSGARARAALETSNG